MISNQISNQLSRSSSISSNHSSLSEFANNNNLSNQLQYSNNNTLPNSMNFNQTTIDPHSTFNQINNSTSTSTSSLPYLPHHSHSHSHSRQSSISGSDTSESHRSIHSNSSTSSSYNSGGGVKKRVASTRQARSDASPYSRDHHPLPLPQELVGTSNSQKSEVDELAQMFDSSRMEYNSSNEGSQFEDGEDDDFDDDDEDVYGDEEEEKENGRRSRSSNDDYDIFVPNGGSAATGGTRKSEKRQSSVQSDGIEGETFFGPHGPQTMMHSGKDPQEVVEVLTRVAEDVSVAHSGSARDKARSIFLQTWLGCSYDLCQDGNASRQALYGCYTHSCSIYKIKPINSAGFGKAVRQKFVDIKTRRLGQRGASRYHYCGIRPSSAEEASLLVRLTKEEAKDDPFPVDSTRMKHKRSSSSNILPATPSTARPNLDNSSSQGSHEVKKSRGIKANSGHKPLSISVPPSRNNLNSQYGNESNQFSAGAQTAVPNQQERARVSVDISIKLPGFPSIEEVLLGGEGSYASLDPELARAFWREYSIHCHGLIEAVRNFRFDQFELIVRTWWTSMAQSKRVLVQNPLISALIYRSDAAIYDDILEFLHSQLTKPMASQAFSSLRVLGENMERIQTVALAAFDGMPFTSPKIELAARFGHLVTRHLGLCQLVQALTGIVSNPSTMNEMALAWSTIDLESIKNQSALVSNCDHRLLSECFAGFDSLIKNIGSVENVIRWVQLCFEGCLVQTQGSRQISPRSLLLRWSFVASQIMRDLTLRSAPAFGSYQIFGLFFEELLSMQVLRQVALQITAINPSATGMNVLFPAQNDLVSPMPAVSYPAEFNNLTVSSSTSQAMYQNENMPYSQGGVGGMDDHLSLLDQFSPKTQEMLRQFSEVNPISPGTFSLYDPGSFDATNSSYSALPPTPHGFLSFANFNNSSNNQPHYSNNSSSFVDSTSSNPLQPHPPHHFNSTGGTGVGRNSFDDF